ncbi:hypothetical protein [Actinokineospora iranica]|uniref:hypothetical protein n=1 Tax=Actinokineospora iranica TaxID=1271860 RepID=UPI0011136314|nr:hypothetical protein [Actinokineospora iranica]
MHLPPLLADLLREHRDRNPDARFVSTGAHGALWRWSNFRRRIWLPALAGNPKLGSAPLQEDMHFHDLHHIHQTRLIEDSAPRVLRLTRLGHRRKDVDDDYSHVTDAMVERMLIRLQTRWEQDGGWTWPETDAVPTKAARPLRYGDWSDHAASQNDQRPAGKIRWQGVDLHV